MSRGTPVTRPGAPGTGFTASAEQMKQMRARASAIDDLMGRDDH
ncbi:MAG TPA: hypothetical protein VGH96_04720 [Streptosporangiaceae bacterium]